MLPLPFLQLVGTKEDNDFMNRLYQQYAVIMIRTAQALELREEDVDIVVADTWIACHAQAARLRTLPPKKLEAYLITSVKNTAINRIRDDQRYGSHHIVHTHRDLQRLATLDEDNWISWFFVKEEIIEILKAIDQLSYREQQILRMHVVEGKRLCDIAKELEISFESASTYLRRGRKHIRQIMKKEGF